MIKIKIIDFELKDNSLEAKLPSNLINECHFKAEITFYKYKITTPILCMRFDDYLIRLWFENDVGAPLQQVGYSQELISEIRKELMDRIVKYKNKEE